jgi:hypothetical protein
MTQKNNLKLDFVKKRLVEMKKDTILAFIIFILSIILLTLITCINNNGNISDFLITDLPYGIIIYGMICLPFFITSLLLRLCIKDLNYLISTSILGVLFTQNFLIMEQISFVDSHWLRLLFSLPGALIAIILFSILYNFLLKKYFKLKFIPLFIFLFFIIGFYINHLTLYSNLIL